MTDGKSVYEVIKLQADEKLKIILAENPSTGHSWSVFVSKVENREQIVNVTDETYLP